jgi:hypothetical protein
VPTDLACRDAETLFDVAARVEQIAGDASPDGALAPFVLALRYDLLEPRSLRRADYGPYVPTVETSCCGRCKPLSKTRPHGTIERWHSVNGIGDQAVIASNSHEARGWPCTAILGRTGPAVG